jgi:signal transduction histidine kinase
MRFMRPERLQLEELDLNTMLTELAHEVNDSGIKISCRLDPSRPTVKVDRAVLMEACRNVIQNAIDAMPKGGTLVLASESQGDGFAAISVTDTGHGIRPEILENIFQLYFTTKEEGTGVGLPLALRAVDLHGGTMKVDSRPGKGTTVTIRLPVAGLAETHRASSSAGRG